MGTVSFPGVEAAGAWVGPSHPHLVPKVLEKSRAIPLLPQGPAWPTKRVKTYLRRRRVFGNRVLRRIFGTKRDEAIGEWRKLHNEELNDLY